MNMQRGSWAIIVDSGTAVELAVPGAPNTNCMVGSGTAVCWLVLARLTLRSQDKSRHETEDLNERCVKGSIAHLCSRPVTGFVSPAALDQRPQVVSAFGARGMGQWIRTSTQVGVLDVKCISVLICIHTGCR
jgi:hypothetical protein